MTTHTPGPWFYDEMDSDGRTNAYVRVKGAHGRNPGIAQVCKTTTAEDWRANARLIAAAPDLLAALRDLVARCDGDEGVRADGSNIQTLRAHAVLDALDAQEIPS